MFESHGPLNNSRINSSFHVELHLRTGELAVKRDELVPIGWKAWKGEIWKRLSGRTYHFISDAGLLILLQTPVDPQKRQTEIPFRVTSHLLASVLFSPHSFLWRGPPLTQQPKEDALFASLLPHTCQCLSSQKGCSDGEIAAFHSPSPLQCLLCSCN